MSAQIPVRERVLLQIVSKLEKMQSLTMQNSDLQLIENGHDSPVPVDDPYDGVQFQFIRREELDRSKQFMGNSVSVLDLDEFYTYQTAYILSSLRVGIEFWYKMKSGDVASTTLGNVLAQLKRIFLSDTNLLEDNEDNTGFIQLCENVRLVQSDYDIEGPFEKVVSGYLQLDFLYRTNKENPYTLM